MPVPAVIALDGAVRDYAWGSTTAIQSMLGVAPDGRPAAELWLGAHPDDPARVPALGTTLDALIATDPAGMLGAAVAAEFGPHLPFLIKVLAADKPLSIQVHPNREHAAAGFAAENARGLPQDAPERNYRDANHKPELLCALTPFEALCGFRPIAGTQRLLAALALAELEPVRELLAGADDMDGLRAAFTYLLTLSDPQPLSVAVAGRAAAIRDGEWSGVARAVEHAARAFPGDVGVVLALLLNHVRLAPGEAIYLGAGNVHAYVRGVGVEIMASSDNVLRCGLTSKHVDVPELLKIADFSELGEPRWPQADAGDSAGLGFGGHRDLEYAVPVPDFELSCVDLDGWREPGRDAGECATGDAGKPYLALCVSGTVRIAVGGDGVTLTPGHGAFVPARESAFTLRGTGRTFLASTG